MLSLPLVGLLGGGAAALTQSPVSRLAITGPRHPALVAPQLLPAADGTRALRLRTVHMFTEPPPAAPTGDPDDEWDAIIEELTKTQRQLKKLGPKTMGTAAVTLTFFSALFAWFLTPPVGRIATLLSLGAGGAAGGQLADRLKKQRRATLPAVVAELIKESGIRELKPSQVEELGQRYGFEPNELEGELKVLYERYLARVVEEEGSQPSEVSTLAALRRGLGLRWNTTAQIHVATGEQLTKVCPEALYVAAASQSSPLRASVPSVAGMRWATRTLLAPSVDAPACLWLCLTNRPTNRLMNRLTNRLINRLTSRLTNRLNPPRAVHLPCTCRAPHSRLKRTRSGRSCFDSRSPCSRRARARARQPLRICTLRWGSTRPRASVS